MPIAGLTCLGLFLALALGTALEVPQHNCADYFSYYKESSGNYFGLFTAPRAGVRSFDWEVIFNADKTGQSHTVGSLMPYPSKDQAFDAIHNGERAQVFLRFQDYGNKLPKLIRAELNGELLCRNNEYDPPSSTMTRRQQMSTSATIRTKVTNSPPPAQPTSPPPPPTRPTQYQFSGQPWNPFLPAVRPKTTPRVEGDFDECGKEGFATVQIGGDDVTRGQYPWLAALYVGESQVTYKCVVSLVSRRTVITAAHCIFERKAAELWVYLGRHDRNQNRETGAELVSVSAVRTPSEYATNRLPDTDIGMLILTESVVYTRYIQPLCLWTSDLHVPRNEGDTGAVAGWGYDSTAQKTRYPKTVTVNLVSRDQCRIKMPRAEDFITDRTICAGNSQGHGPCFGDSGAGLIVLRNNRWVLRGVVSLSPRQGEICDLSQYAIYCDVSTYRDWIQTNMVT
ncbi:hypothetical protein KR018_001355 [Drosophila ironensis]|nr:hypothetical protein KR018_001355 [Drosophila ironensis]